MKKNYSQTLHFVSMLAVLAVMLLSPLYGLAAAPQPTEYEPLAPLTTGTDPKVTSGTYIPFLFRLGIGIAAGLAVLAIAYSGLKYMMSDVVTNKSDAKTGIKNALLGLLLALGSFLLLQTINPDLTNLDFGNTVPTLPSNINIEPAPQTYEWTLSYYASRWDFVAQSYDWELQYINTASRVIRIRYNLKSTCMAQILPAKSNIQPGTADPQCSRKIAYAVPPQGSYIYGSIITTNDLSAGTYFDRPAKTYSYTSQITCDEQRSALVDMPDEYDVTTTCTSNGSYGALQKTTWSDEGACRQEEARLSLPTEGATITQTCTLIQAEVNPYE